MLANGAGKSRSTREGSARRAAQWRLLFLSSGEIGLAAKVAEGGTGKRLAAGQQVRVIDVAADAGAGRGLFENLHGFATAESLATHLRMAAVLHYGLAGRAFLEHVVADLDGVKAAVQLHSKDFVTRYVPEGADGQIYRVAQRFALIAAGGELAVAARVLPWPPGEATLAAGLVYRTWLQERGGVEPAEIRNGIMQVRGFLLSNGMSRFAPAWEQDAKTAIPMRDVAGYRKREDGGWDYFVNTSAWRDEVCLGLDPKAVAAQLHQRGMLVAPASGPHRSKSLKVPGIGKLRLYHIPAAFLEADRDD